MLNFDIGTLSNFFVNLVLTAIAIVAATHALLTKRDSKSALAWVAFCLVVPFFGPLIYLIFGINRVATKAHETYPASTKEDSSNPLQEPPAVNLRPLSLVGESVTGLGLRSCDEIRILENGEALYPAMLADIDNAKTKVYCATYIFQNDNTGNQFVDALVRAQQRGVDVRIILDGLGGTAYRPRIGNKLLKRGLNYKRFNPITLIPPALHINMRNHRKILVVDGSAAYSGGQNIGDRHLVSKPNNPDCARDLHFRMTGKIVDDLERAFLKDWYHCSGLTEHASFFPSNTNRSESEVWTRLILDGPNENLDKLNELLVGILSLARDRIWIMTPYFLPGLDLVGALMAAQLRGVDVKILLPEKTNIHMAHWASQHGLQHILARDLEVYLQPAPFIHTKALLIDDNYTLIGSANLDPRSLRLNYELGIEVFNEQFASEIHDYFQSKLDAATQLDAEKLSKRPHWIRIRNAIAWLFSPYL
jgi:cardiolipin synthase